MATTLLCLRNILAVAVSYTLTTTQNVSGQRIQVPYFIGESIVVDATINQKPARFVFDTGSSLTALFKPALGRLGIESDSAGTMMLASHEVDVRRTKPIDVSIFGKQVQTRLAVLPFSHRFDGVLGWRDIPVPLLIDGYDRRIQQQNTVPPLRGVWQSWHMEPKNSQLFIVVPYNDEAVHRVFIDTGVAGGLRLSPSLWNEWKKQNVGKPMTLETFQYSVGDPMVSEVAWVDEYQLGKLTFRNLDIGVIPTAIGNSVVDKDGKKFAATIGTRALRQMRLIISRGTNEVWTQPLSGIPRHNRLGAVFALQAGDNQSLICQLLLGTPADEAGLKNGDVLLQVDEHKFEEYSKSHTGRLKHLFSQPAGTSITLRVRRGEMDVTMVTTLRDLLQ